MPGAESHAFRQGLVAKSLLFKCQASELGTKCRPGPACCWPNCHLEWPQLFLFDFRFPSRIFTQCFVHHKDLRPRQCWSSCWARPHFTGQGAKRFFWVPKMRMMQQLASSRLWALLFMFINFPFCHFFTLQCGKWYNNPADQTPFL